MGDRIECCKPGCEADASVTLIHPDSPHEPSYACPDHVDGDDGILAVGERVFRLRDGEEVTRD